MPTRSLPPLIFAVFCLSLLLIPAGLARAGENAWTPIGPEGGWISQVAFDPQTPGTVYAGTGGGVFKSTNNGQHWSPAGVLSITANSSDLYISALAVDPQTPTTLYAGTWGNSLFPRSTLFKSPDGGDTWSGLSISGSVWDIAIHPTDTDIVYAATDAGVFKSSDGGTNWAPSNTGLPSNTNVRGLAIDPITPANLYAVTHGKVYKSANGGVSWSLSFQTTGDFEQVLVNPSDPAIVYAAGYGTGLIKSVDGGVSWAPITGLYSQNTQAVALDPAAPDTLYISLLDGGAFKSTNGGESWSPLLAFGLTRALVLAVDLFSPGTVYAGTENSVLRSPDGGTTWETRNTGLTAFNILDLALPSQLPGTIYAISDNGGGFLRTADGGVTWTNDTRLNPGLATLAVDPLAPGTLYVGYYGAAKSLDGGETWSQINFPPFGPSFITALAINPVTTSIVYAGSDGDGIFKSEDGGLSWSSRSAGLPADIRVEALAVDPFRPDTLYAAGSNPISRIYKSADGGTSWQEHSTGLLAWDEISDLALDPQHPDVVYAASPACGCVYRSVDGGQHWSAGEMMNHYIHTLAIDPARPEILYAGTWDGGVYLSTDAGYRWLPLNAGLPPRAHVEALAVDPTEPDTVYASVRGWGIFHLHLSPDLDLAKSVDNSRPQPGQQITYRLAIDSRVPVAGAVLSDTLPAGLTLAGPVSLEPPQPGAALAQSAADLPTLAANLTINTGQVLTLTLPVTVDGGLADGTTIINVAEITAATLLTPYRSAAFISVDSPPVLGLAKSVDNAGPAPGQPITYTITVHNTGGRVATGAVLSDTLPAGLALAGPVSLEPPQPGTALAQSAADLPTLAANLTIDVGQSFTLTLPVTVNTGLADGTTIINVAEITATALLTPYHSEAFISVDSPPVLGLAKSVDNSRPQPGQPVTYTITVHHTDGGTATGAVISDTLPAGLALAGPVSLEPPQPGAVLAQSAADLPTLAANLTIDVGQSFTLTLPVTVNTGLVSGTRIANTASVTAPAALYAPQTDTITLTVTADVTPPGSFFLLSPPPDTITAATRPVFDWTDAAGAVSYTLTVSGTTPVTTTLSQARPPDDLAGGAYTWTVLAHRAAASPAPAANGPWHFTIRTLKETYLPLILKP